MFAIRTDLGSSSRWKEKWWNGETVFESHPQQGPKYSNRNLIDRSYTSCGRFTLLSPMPSICDCFDWSNRWNDVQSVHRANSSRNHDRESILWTFRFEKVPRSLPSTRKILFELTIRRSTRFRGSTWDSRSRSKEQSSNWSFNMFKLSYSRY